MIILMMIIIIIITIITIIIIRIIIIIIIIIIGISLLHTFVSLILLLGFELWVNSCRYGHYTIFVTDITL